MTTGVLGWEHLQLKGVIEIAQIAYEKRDLIVLPTRAFQLRESIRSTSGALTKTGSSSNFEKTLQQSVKFSLQTAEKV